MAEPGFSGPKGPVINPPSPGPSDAPLPGFRRMSSGETTKVVGDWSDGQPPFMSSMRATARYRSLEDKVPALARIAFGVALGLPAGHFVPPLYLLIIPIAFAVAFGVLYLMIFRARLQMLEVSRESERHYVDLESVAGKSGLTGLDAAALLANPNLRAVKRPDGAEVLTAIPEKVGPHHVQLGRPAIIDKNPNGGAA